MKQSSPCLIPHDRFVAQPGLMAALVLIATSALPPAMSAATVWNGPHITWANTDGVDQITPNAWITRGGTQGLYNSKQEAAFAHFLSPKDTEWADGTTANYSTLSYTDWDTWAKTLHGGPPSTIGLNAVVHLKTDDIYLDIKFITWATFGPYSYERSTLSTANTLPTVAITNPVNNATFANPATVTIMASASDADGSVTNVEFFDGTTSLGSVASLPYNLSVVLATGVHPLMAVATDNSGASNPSAVVNVTVTAGNVPPVVSILSPTNNTLMTIPTNVTIEAAASDSDGTVASVQFYDGTNLLGSSIAAPYSILSTFYPGAHSLTAVATDNSGGATTSGVVLVTVSSVIITNPIVARIPKGNLAVELQTVADGLAAPISMAVPDDNSGRMFVYDQDGRAWVVTVSGRASTPLVVAVLIDITFSAKLASHGFREGNRAGVVFCTQIIAHWS